MPLPATMVSPMVRAPADGRSMPARQRARWSSRAGRAEEGEERSRRDVEGEPVERRLPPDRFSRARSTWIRRSGMHAPVRSDANRPVQQAIGGEHGGDDDGRATPTEITAGPCRYRSGSCRGCPGSRRSRWRCRRVQQLGDGSSRKTPQTGNSQAIVSGREMIGSTPRTRLASGPAPWARAASCREA